MYTGNCDKLLPSLLAQLGNKRVNTTPEVKFAKQYDYFCHSFQFSCSYQRS